MKLLQLQKRSMALAGTVMTGYLIFHMLSNLSFFAGSAFENFYRFYNQAWVRWPLLVLVLLSLLIHVKAAISIRIQNSKARQTGYKKHDKPHVPAILVTISIALLLTFILIHIVQMLTLDTNQVVFSIESMFNSVWMLLFYLAGLFILAMHLQHSLVNVLQTLGITSNMYKVSIISSVVILTVGFASVPLFIWASA